ncbi:hypothetical protein CSPX01_11586, partial [Colletotrichum filicis]
RTFIRYNIVTLASSKSPVHLDLAPTRPAVSATGTNTAEATYKATWASVTVQLLHAPTAGLSAESAVTKLERTSAS